MANSTSLITLEVGQTAPEITTMDVLGRPFSIKTPNHRFVLLAFMRFADCPWCNLAVEYPRFLDNDCEVVAFIQSDRNSIVTNIHERHAVRPDFPIIADKEAVFYKKYGVRYPASAAVVARSITKIPMWVHAVTTHGFKQHSLDGKKFLVPAYFLVDAKTGTIASADYGKSFYDHDTFVKLYADIFSAE